MTARSLGKFYFTDGDTLERCYKESLSGFREWDQLEHAQDWVLLPDNMGEHLSIDETSLQDDLFTFLTNKDGHCQQGTLIAAVRGTKAEDVLSILLQIPAEARLKVKEITADLSESMAAIIHQAFPNAILTLDCFHIMRRCLDALEELRLRFKRDAQAEIRRLALEHKKNWSATPRDAGRTVRRTNARRPRASVAAANRSARTRSSGRPCSPMATPPLNC